MHNAPAAADWRIRAPAAAPGAVFGTHSFGRPSPDARAYAMIECGAGQNRVA
jgi:hypothetical protein